MNTCARLAALMFAMLSVSPSWSARDLCTLHITRLATFKADPDSAYLRRAASLIAAPDTPAHTALVEAMVDSDLTPRETRTIRLSRETIADWIADLRAARAHVAQDPELTEYAAEMQRRIEAAQPLLTRTPRGADVFIDQQGWRTLVWLMGAHFGKDANLAMAYQTPAATRVHRSSLFYRTSELTDLLAGRHPTLSLFPYDGKMGTAFIMLLAQLGVAAIEVTPANRFVRNTDADTAIANVRHDLGHIPVMRLEEATLEERLGRREAMRSLMHILEPLSDSDAALVLETLLWFAAASWRQGEEFQPHFFDREFDISIATDLTRDPLNWLRAVAWFNFQAVSRDNRMVMELQQTVEVGPFPQLQNAILSRFGRGGRLTIQQVHAMIRPLLLRLLHGR